MELKNIFPNMSATMPRYSAYEILKKQDVRYIMPTTNAATLPYSYSDCLSQLLSDALNLGRAIYTERENLDHVCVEFVQKYGLLGLHKKTSRGAIPLTNDRVSPAREAHTSQGYGEEYSHFVATFETLYLHFLSTRGELPNNLSSHLQMALDTMTATPIPSGFSYLLTATNPPQLVWQTNDLLDVLRLAYGLAVTDTAAPLKVCKHCGKVYYNVHQKSEFCSVKCRNHYNVKAFREREKKESIDL